MNQRTHLLAIAVAGVALLAGCSQSDADPPAVAATAAAAPATTTPPPPTTVAPSAVVAEAGVVAAKLGQTDLGDVLTDTNGLTLYAFTNDVDAISTCYGTCEEAWPPVIVDANWTVGPGLDTGVFSTTTREDGSLQLVAGKFPLYTFGGDAAPGDITGQGSGDVWFAMTPKAKLILFRGEGSEAPATTAAPAPATTAAPAPADTPPPVSVGTTGVGDALVDADGMTLYGFTNDADGTPTCVDDCAGAWPPVLVDTGDLPAGLDPEVFSVVARPDGSWQLKAGAWPLYRFSGDAAPGDANGQGSGGVWFVAGPTGGLIKD